MDAIRLICFIFISAMLLGCEESSDETEETPPVLTASFRANIAHDSNEVVIAAGLEYEGERVQMVGGDVFVASNGDQEVALTAIDETNKTYVGAISLESPLPENNHSINIEVKHDAIAASDGRWYPIDLLQVDPGAGEYVGKFGNLSIPQVPVEITAPQANSIYSDLSQTITIEWDNSVNPNGEPYASRVAGVSACHSGRYTLYIYFEKVFDDDPGTATYLVEDFVFNPYGSLRPSTIQDYLLAASLGAVYWFVTLDTDNFNEFLDFESKSCSVEINVFRELRNDISEDFDDGYAIGSRSAQVTVEYQQ